MDKKLQDLFNKKDNNGNYSILTINLNNLQNYKKFIDLSINLLKNK